MVLFATTPSTRALALQALDPESNIVANICEHNVSVGVISFPWCLRLRLAKQSFSPLPFPKDDCSSLLLYFSFSAVEKMLPAPLIQTWCVLALALSSP